jgi:hypothetical protein
MAENIQCVTKQNQFKILNLITKLDAAGKNWIISGQVKNVATPTPSIALSNIHVIAHFYDSRGNNIGGVLEVPLTPRTLKTLQSGVFNIKADTSTMSGIPTFIRLELQSS